MKTVSQYNSIKLLKNGIEFIKENIELINQAKSIILIHTYIFKDDEVTLPIIEALIEAKKRKVHIFVIVDAFGSSEFSKKAQETLKQNSIDFCFYKPLLSFKNIGRRLHQKVLFVDNQKAIIGGINYAKEFNNPTGSVPWLDYACLIEGEEAYKILKKIKHLYFKSFPNFKKVYKTIPCANKNLASEVIMRTNENDWFRNKQEIYESYIEAIESAEAEIIIMATYFIPGKKLLKALKNARKRDVKVRLIFGSQSDHPIVSKSSDYYYEWYLNNKIEVYEWSESIIHGKMALVDSAWVTIGSYNHNYISRYGNLELNLEVINMDFAQIIRNEFDQVITGSNEITSSNLSKTVGNKIIVYFVYLLTNLITFISIVLIFKDPKESRKNY